MLITKFFENKGNISKRASHLSFLIKARLQAVIWNFFVEAVDVVDFFEIEEIEKILRQVLTDEVKAAFLYKFDEDCNVFEARRDFGNFDLTVESENAISLDEEVL